MKIATLVCKSGLSLNLNGFMDFFYKEMLISLIDWTGLD